MGTKTRRRDVASPLDCYLSEIDETALLTEPEEQNLARRIAAGDVEARDRMARANLRLVVRIAREYVGKGLALEDLISEGNVGMLRAVEAFQAGAGTRFSTYASYWIKQSIRGALNKSGYAVRLPQYMGTLLVKWRRTEGRLRDELGRDASQAEIVAELGLSKSQVRAVLRAQKAVVSGRAGLGSDDSDPTEFLADDRVAAPDDRLAGEDEVRAAVGSLGRLAGREAAVLRLRFGLDGDKPATLQEVGEQLGFTRERARQIERDALANLRGRLTA